MTWKSYVTVAGLFGVLACAGLLAAALITHDNITVENYDRIEPGMTIAEIETIFGAKGRLGEFQAWSSPNMIGMVWNGHDGTACVLFENGSVTNSDRVPCKGWTDGNESVLKRIRRWLHLH